MHKEEMGVFEVIRGMYEWERIHVSRHMDMVNVTVAVEWATMPESVANITLKLEQAKEVVRALQEAIDLEVQK